MRAGALNGWMARFTKLEDAEAEELLQGSTPTGRDDLAPVAELIVVLRERSTASVPEIGPSLRSQMQERPRVAPRYVAVARRRLQLAGVAAAAVVVVGGVAASQNALPAPAQRIVSVAAHLAGIDVPGPEGDDEEPASTPPGDDGDSTAPDEPDVSTPPATPATSEPGSGTPGAGPSSTAGPPEQTPGGATPADPGTPGDGEPATPAVPPAHSNAGGNGSIGSESSANRAANGPVTGR